MSNAGTSESDTLDQDLIFISYSHSDSRWQELLLRTLRPYIENVAIKYWDDTHIRPGEEWEAALADAQSRARAAILLVSSNYLDSDYIRKVELPLLIEAARERHLKLFWVLLDHCGWDILPIRAHQCLHDPAHPLIDLKDADLSRQVDQICRRIRAGITGAEETKGNTGGPVIDSPRSQDTLLLMGYLYYEVDGQEYILVRGDSRLPIIKVLPHDIGSLSDIYALANQTLLDFFHEIAIPQAEIFAAGFYSPELVPLLEIQKSDKAVEPRSWVFLKLRLTRPVSSNSALWRERDFQWKPKDVVTRVWHNDSFVYGFNDRLEEEHPLPGIGIRGGPYKILIQDRVLLDLGRRVLDCVDMLIFRRSLRRRIEFLLVQRKDDKTWEYPKGGMEYHESPIEGALREIEEEVGFAKNELQYCGYLGWQMPDVSYRHKFYDTLRVHGLTFHYTGNHPQVDIARMFEHQSYKWLPLAEAKDAVSALPYGGEFFDRWKTEHPAILSRAKITGKLS